MSYEPWWIRRDLKILNFQIRCYHFITGFCFEILKRRKNISILEMLFLFDNWITIEIELSDKKMSVIGCYIAFYCLSQLNGYNLIWFIHFTLNFSWCIPKMWFHLLNKRNTIYTHFAFAYSTAIVQRKKKNYNII